MTELEKIKGAKEYIDRLANGINPTDETMVPDGDVINDVRISRCFFYISDVLRCLIENNGTYPSAARSQKKEAFAVPFEKRARFRYSEKPIPVSEIAKRLNELADGENMKKLSYSGILAWLMEIGMIRETTTSSGKHLKRPTENGAEIGITVEERTGENGTYHVVVYSTEAQEFIVDNLDAVLETANHRSNMQGMPWTPEEEAHLVELYRKSKSLSEIAEALKRNESGVSRRLRKLGYTLP